MATSSGNNYTRTVAIVVGSAAAAALVGGLIYYYRRKSVNQRAPTKRGSGKPTISKDKRVVEKEAVSGPLAKAISLKNKGNECFKAAKYDEAIKYYSEAIESCVADADSLMELSAFYQNRAAAQEKLENFTAVVEDCTKALEGNGRYIKAIIRRGKAYERMQKYKDAFHDFTAACILEGFSNFHTMKDAEEALQALCAEQAKRAMSERAGRPIPLSKSFVDSYLLSFSEDPILNEVATNSCSEGGGGDHKEINIVVNGDSAGGDTLSGFEKIKYLLKTKQYDNIIDACTEEIDTNGGHQLEATLLRGTFSLLSGASKAALDDFGMFFKAVKSLPPGDNRVKKLTSNAYIKRASLHMQQGNKDPSFEDFQAAQDADPENADVYLHRGQIYSLIMDFEQSMSEFDKAVELRPDFPLCLAQRCYTKYRRAMASTDASAMHQAMAEFQRIIENHSECAEAYALYGQALAEHEDYDEARRLFDKALELSPANANIYVHKGLLEAQSKNGGIAASIRMIEQALELDPFCGFAYEALGTSELQRGNIDRALEMLEKALSYARTELELTHLYSLYEAAYAQKEVAKKLHVPLSNIMSSLG